MSVHSLLICNSDPAELEPIRAALGARYRVSSLQSWNGKPVDLAAVDAIVLDNNFTQAKGLDFVMEACSRAHVPILFTTPPDDPQLAIEAQRIGVFNYLVKTEKMLSVLDLAVRDMIVAFNDQRELKRTVLAQRARIAELEASIGVGAGRTARKPPGWVAVPPGAITRSALLQQLGRRLSSGEINLPALPGIAPELSELVRQGAPVAAIAALLRKDMTIVARLMSIANSAYFRRQQPSATLEQAIGVLGMAQVKKYVDVIVNRGLYTVRNRSYQPTLRELWRHGYGCAHGSELLAERAGLQGAGEIFLSGLLHDIGKTLLLQVAAELDGGGILGPGVAGDFEAFLVQHHGVAGRKLLEVWKLPPAFGIVAQFHDAPELAPELGPTLLAVHAGNLLAKHCGFGSWGAGQDYAALERACSALQLAPAMIGELSELLKLRVEQVGLSFD